MLVIYISHQHVVTIIGNVNNQESALLPLFLSCYIYFIVFLYLVHDIARYRSIHLRWPLDMLDLCTINLLHV